MTDQQLHTYAPCIITAGCSGLAVALLFAFTRDIAPMGIHITASCTILGVVGGWMWCARVQDDFLALQ